MLDGYKIRVWTFLLLRGRETIAEHRPINNYTSQSWETIAEPVNAYSLFEELGVKPAGILATGAAIILNRVIPAQLIPASLQYNTITPITTTAPSMYCYVKKEPSCCCSFLFFAIIYGI